MPLLDHFHPPLHGPRRWEGFHHYWAGAIAKQLNDGVLPPDYFAEPEISIGPDFEIDVATLEKPASNGGTIAIATATWAPPRPRIRTKVSFAQLDTIEVRVYQDLDGPILRGVIELISPSNKDRESSRRTFAAKCAGHIKHGIGLVIVDVVTNRSANLHEDMFDMLDIKTRRAAWKSPTGLYAVAYRPIPVVNSPHIEVWPERIALGKELPTMPLWLRLDLCVPVRLKESYQATCSSLRIPA
jgi:hypothetical protein